MDDSEVERTFPMNDYDEVEQVTPTVENVAGRVRVLQTPSAFVIELGISPPDTTEYTKEKLYTPGEARQVADQIQDAEAPKLTRQLGESQAIDIAAQLNLAANIAGSKAIGEMVGDEVIRAYTDEKITEDEFMHEFSREVDKALEER